MSATTIGQQTVDNFLRFADASGIQPSQDNLDLLVKQIRINYADYFKEVPNAEISFDAFGAVFFLLRDHLVFKPVPAVQPIVQTITIEKKSREERAEEKFRHEEAIRRSGLPSQADLQEEAKKKHDLAKQLLSNLGKVQEALTSKPEVDNSVQIARRTLPANPEAITREQAISFLRDPEISAQTIRKLYQEYPAVQKRINEVTR